MRPINRIIIHMAYTRPSMDVGVYEIRDWHVNGNGWRDIGYHFVIRRSGEIEDGRPVEQPGAHTKGRNSDSIGICLVGGRRENADAMDVNYTRAQWDALMHLVGELKAEHPSAQVRGHRDYAERECPGFDVAAWWGE